MSDEEGVREEGELGIDKGGVIKEGVKRESEKRLDGVKVGRE